MDNAAKATRQNRTLTVDFQDPSTYFELINDGKAFVEFVLAFILSIGFQLAHKTTCTGGSCLTRHSHYARVRLDGLTIWRIQCTSCKAVFTVLPHFVLRYRRMSPDVARQALIQQFPLIAFYPLPLIDSGTLWERLDLPCGSYTNRIMRKTDTRARCNDGLLVNCAYGVPDDGGSSH